MECNESPRCEIPETFMVVATGIFGIEMKAIGYLYWIP